MEGIDKRIKIIDDKMLQLQDIFKTTLAEQQRVKLIPKKNQHLFRELLKKAKHNASTNAKVKTVEGKNKMLQEPNIKLENQLERATKNLADVGSEKLDTLECLTKEKEARIVLEKKLDSLREELERANEKVKTLEDKNKMLQEQNMKLDNQLERTTETLADVGSEKLDALEGLMKEKEATTVLEKKLDSLREELEKANNEKVKTLEDKNKMLQEHNMKLENANKNLEREKDMILLKYNITLEKLCGIYEGQIADSGANAKDSRDGAAKQKETSEEN